MFCLLNLIRGLFCIFRALSTACRPKFPRRATYRHLPSYYHSRLLHAPSTCKLASVTIHNKQGGQEMTLSAIHTSIYPQRKPCNPFEATFACTFNQSKVFSYKSLTLYIAKNEQEARNREYYTSATSFTCAIGCNEIEWLYIPTRENFTRSFSSYDLVNLPSNGAAYPTSPNGLECPFAKCIFFECSLNQVNTFVTCVW